MLNNKMQKVFSNIAYLSFLLLLIIALLCFWFLPIDDTEEENGQKKNKNFIAKSEEIIVLEIPHMYYEEDLIRIANEIAYQNYMSKLTENNIEYWWYGYQIMIQDFEDQPEHLTDIYSEEELKHLYWCVEIEAHDGDFLSKVNVANVIFNRLADGRYGDSLIEVLTAENQFACRPVDITESTIQACAYAFEMEDTTNGALSFHSNSHRNTFNNQDYLFTDNIGHHFYK